MMKELSKMLAESMDKGKGSKDGGNELRDEHSGAIVLNQFKKIDDLLKFIRECIEKCKFEEIVDTGEPLFSLALICGGSNEFRKYDEESKKYTVVGEKKASLVVWIVVVVFLLMCCSKVFLLVVIDCIYIFLI